MSKCPSPFFSGIIVFLFGNLACNVKSMYRLQAEHKIANVFSDFDKNAVISAKNGVLRD